MKLSSLGVTFHRTVRVAEGRQPSNLPPSLGTMELHRVKEYDKKCPKNWERDGFFVALHDTEALWMSFQADHPVAILVGAGGINALTGEKLGTNLEKDNYLVAPPQPWLDGWKDKDGTVYQFVATPYKKGEGISVAEQLIGKQSKTGALGLAVFDPKDRSKLTPKHKPLEGWNGSAYEDDFNYPNMSFTTASSSMMSAKSLVSKPSSSVLKHAVAPTRARGMTVNSSFSEMGIGKGGKIIQKIYPDPYGMDAWQEKPSATLAIYLVNAMVFEEITGKKVPIPVGHETYDGKWFGLQDKQEEDIAGSGKFTGLKSAVFPASDLNEKPIKKPKKQKEVAVSK